MSIKDMRNRRVHNISKHHPIHAREAYVLADNATRFFELMTIEVSKQVIAEFHQFRRESLKLLFVEEMYKEANQNADPYINKPMDKGLNQQPPQNCSQQANMGMMAQ